MMNYAVLGRSLAVALATTTVAQAQQLPTTVPLVNNVTKEKIGTATIWGRQMVLRKTDGTFIATVVIGPDGKRTGYDENGKVIERIPEGLIPDQPN